MACLALNNAWQSGSTFNLAKKEGANIRAVASLRRRSNKCGISIQESTSQQQRRRRSSWILRAAEDDSNTATVDSKQEKQEKKSSTGSDSNQNGSASQEQQEKKQEMDWKDDENFKKSMGGQSIEAALKLEKKRAEQRLKELNSEQDGNVFTGLLQNITKSIVEREKANLEKVESKFKALDLSKLKNCFGFDTFFANDVRRFGDGGIFIGNLRRPVEEVIPILKERLSKAAGREVTIWLMEQEEPDTESKKQVCVVQPKEEIELQYELNSLNNFAGYFSALLLGVTTFGTIALTSGFFLSPSATVDDYVSRVLPLFGGFLTILGVSEIATRLTARHHGVKLSPSFLIPSTWTGCLGVVNNYESILPNKKALFDIAAARTTSAYITSSLLTIIAFSLDQSLNGGDNALYIRPEFFYNNPLLSFIQYVTGPYADELGNVLPQAVEGLGVPIDPLAFAGLLGIVVTSLNLLPCGRLEGGRIAQALFGRRIANIMSFFTNISLGIGGITGSVLSLTWGFVATFFRGGEELPAEDEITPLGNGRMVWGYALAVFCLLTLFPNSAGTFPSAFYTPPFFRGGDGF